jgi:hypothetical protein
VAQRRIDVELGVPRDAGDVSERRLPPRVEFDQLVVGARQRNERP